MDDLFPLAVVDFLRHISDLSFWAECPASEALADPDAWATKYRDKINSGTAGAIAWLHSRKGRPWPPQAQMTREGLQSAVRKLGSDALHLVTIIQSSDCWGVRFSSWPGAADRELVDRVRSWAAAIGDLVELLLAPAARHPVTGHADPILEPVDIDILKKLAKRPGVSHSQYDLTHAGDRKTIGQRLRYLRTIGYAAHPEGRKRGNVITAEGAARLKSLAETSP